MINCRKTDLFPMSALSIKQHYLQWVNVPTVKRFHIYSCAWLCCRLHWLSFNKLNVDTFFLTEQILDPTVKVQTSGHPINLTMPEFRFRLSSSHMHFLHGIQVLNLSFLNGRHVCVSTALTVSIQASQNYLINFVQILSSFMCFYASGRISRYYSVVDFV